MGGYQARRTVQDLVQRTFVVAHGVSMEGDSKANASDTDYHASVYDRLVGIIEYLVVIPGLRDDSRGCHEEPWCPGVSFGSSLQTAIMPST